MPAPILIVVAGVSGSGKSTVGALVAERLGLRFVDADDLHPDANVAKMVAGIPLTDDDRWPWLRAVGAELAAAAAASAANPSAENPSAAKQGGLVVACSALRRAYRDAIRSEAPDTVFALLDGPPELLADRVAARRDHFMPSSLLASQLALLEPLDSDERGLTVAIDAQPAALAERIAVDVGRASV
jgi:gluconokinase